MTGEPAVEVLLLAHLHDFSTDRVCIELQRKGVRYARVNSETLRASAIRLDPVAARLEIETDGVNWLIDNTLKAVWWRQPTFARNAPGVALTLEEQLERSQWGAFLRGLMLFDQAKWINDPSATYRAECKPWQLRVASRAGFLTPRTIITNDPDAQVEAEIGRSVALKPVDTVLLRDASHQYFAFMQLVDWQEAATPDLMHAPVIVQEPIEPKIDLRVTVVGDRAWAVGICQDGGGIRGDWRLQKKAVLAYEAATLPDQIERRCIELVNSMGLVFGGIDLARQGDDYFFIEINPTGEWGWLDDPKRPISSSIADALVG